MVNTTPQVVVAAVEGYAIAGGFGLLCVSDVAICTEDAGFAMSETAIGIVPAQIAPFVAARIGVPQTRHLALTAARFKGPEAYRLGIAHHLVKDAAALDARLEEVLKQIDRCAPLANALTKAVVRRSAASRCRRCSTSPPTGSPRRGAAPRPPRACAPSPRSGRRDGRSNDRTREDSHATRAVAVAPPICRRASDRLSRRRTTRPAASAAAGALGDAFGLSQFGVNLLELPPGAWSSQRHWHERQDELSTCSKARSRW